MRRMKRPIADNRRVLAGLALSALALTACATGTPLAPSAASTQTPTTASTSSTSPPPATPTASGPERTPKESAAPPTPRPTPAGPYVASVGIPQGCLVIGPGIAGVKVHLIQKALGLGGRPEVYDQTTEAAVSTVQRNHHLPATGRVDAATWKVLGTGYPFCIDRFTRQPGVAPPATASAHAQAALAFARSQVGTPYIWGGAGPIGYDCSGLALQALYAAGRVVPGVTTDRHVENDFNTAAAIYRSTAFGHLPLSRRRPGDLVFWGADLHHMALYLGGDRVVEAVRPVVRIASLWSHGAPLPDVARPFPE